MSSGSPACFFSEQWLKAPGYLHLSAPLEPVAFGCYGNTSPCRKPSFVLPQTHFTGQFRHTSVSQKESLGPQSQEAVSYCLLSAQEGGEENWILVTTGHLYHLGSQAPVRVGRRGGDRMCQQWPRQWKKWTVSLDHLPEGNTPHLLCLNKNLSQYFISTLWVYKMKHWPTSLGTRHLKAPYHGLKLLCQAKPF